MLKIITSPSLGRVIGIVRVLGFMNQVNPKLRRIWIRTVNSHGGDHTFERSRCTTRRKKHLVGLLPVWKVAFRVEIRVTK